MDTAELDLNLARFYVEARMKKGEEYCRSALRGFRNSIERYLNNNGRTVKISRSQVFQKSKKILGAKLQINRCAGKENIQHKPIIVPSDLAKIRASPFLSVTNPAGLRECGYTFLCTGAGVEGRDSEIFAATVSSSPKMQTAVSTQL